MLSYSVRQLIQSSLAPRTRKMYERVWSDLSTFCQQYLSKQLKIPVSISTLAMSLAYLHNKGYAESTISSYNSAVGYYHKLENAADTSTSFFISKLIQVVKKQKTVYR